MTATTLRSNTPARAMAVSRRETGPCDRRVFRRSHHEAPVLPGSPPDSLSITFQPGAAYRPDNGAVRSRDSAGQSFLVREGSRSWTRGLM